jgi:hypothetical protein
MLGAKQSGGSTGEAQRVRGALVTREGPSGGDLGTAI